MPDPENDDGIEWILVLNKFDLLYSTIFKH